MSKVKEPEQKKAQTVVKQSPEDKAALALGQHAGDRVTAYMDMKWPEIPEFTEKEEAQDAKGALLIACHILANAEKFAVEKIQLLDKDGKPIKVKGKTLTTFAIPLKHFYDVVAQNASDVSMFHGANALTSGMYRVSLPDNSMVKDGKATYAKGGIYFAKSKKISLKGGYYFTLPQLSQTGWYKRQAPKPTMLKDICVRFAKRITPKKKVTK